MSNDEIDRFSKMEHLLENKISKRFKIRRASKDDFGYIIEHIYGQTGTPYEEYSYHLPTKKLKKETLVKRYDLLKPTRCLIEENQRYVKIENEDETTYAAYFTINSVIGELGFLNSEIFYYQQQRFSFPIDTSMNVEIVTNKKALSIVRNKKKECKRVIPDGYLYSLKTTSHKIDDVQIITPMSMTGWIGFMKKSISS